MRQPPGSIAEEARVEGSPAPEKPERWSRRVLTSPLIGGPAGPLEAAGRACKVSPATILALLFVVVGVAFRARQFALGRSLWFDEATLALNIVSRSFAGLLGPLDYGQVAPPGFLLVQKTLVSVFGNSDYVLRLVPFTASIAGLSVAYTLVRERLASMGVVFLGLLCTSQWLIYYASEAKQYSSDVLCFLVVLAGVSACLKPTARRRHFVHLGLAGTLSLWLSHPAIFALAGAGTCLAIDRLLKKDWHGLRWVATLAAVWLLNFTIVYFISLRAAGASTNLLTYWGRDFMPMPPWTDAAWFSNAFISALYNPLGLPLLGGAILIAIGYVSLLWRGWQLAVCLTVVVFATLLASGVHKYAVGGRLLLFAVPAFYLLVAVGIDRLAILVARADRHLAWIGTMLLATALLYGPAAAALSNFRRPLIGEHIKPLMALLRERTEQGDAIYVYYGAVPAFKYYRSFYATDGADIILGLPSRRTPTQYLRQLERLRPRRRVWILFSHDCTWCTVDEEAYMVAHLDRIGTRQDQHLSSGASLYLYDLSSGG